MAAYPLPLEQIKETDEEENQSAAANGNLEAIIVGGPGSSSIMIQNES
jgi:hypothetical protein